MWKMHEVFARPCPVGPSAQLTTRLQNLRLANELAARAGHRRLGSNFHLNLASNSFSFWGRHNSQEVLVCSLIDQESYLGNYYDDCDKLAWWLIITTTDKPLSHTFKKRKTLQILLFSPKYFAEKERKSQRQNFVIRLQE